MTIICVEVNYLHSYLHLVNVQVSSKKFTIMLYNFLTILVAFALLLLQYQKVLLQYFGRK